MTTQSGFEYFECRPVIEHKGGCDSYRCERYYQMMLGRMCAEGVAFKTFWTLYGWKNGKAVAIGDFKSKRDCHDTMMDILGPLVEIRNILDNANGVPRRAQAVCEDVLLQSSNEERI